MKRYHYTLAEQETIINWDNELDEATVYTFDRRLISKLKALAAKYPEHYVLLDKGAQRSVTYRVPKRCIGIRPLQRYEKKTAGRGRENQRPAF